MEASGVAPVREITGQLFTTQQFKRRRGDNMATATNDLDDVIDTTDDALDELLSELLNDPLPESTEKSVITPERVAYCDQQLAAAIEDAKREGVLVFDVETVPDETRFPRPKLPEPVSLGAEIDALLANPKATVEHFKEVLRKNLIAEEIEKIEQAERKGKNRAGVIEACNSARGGGNPEFDAWKKLSLNPIGCRITALGWAIGNGEVKSFVATNDAEERLLLQAWWALIDGQDRRHCGFNTLGFDIPVLTFRSCRLKVRIGRQLDLSRYSNRECIDLMLKLPFQGKCKDICRGLDIEIPAGDMDGSQVLDLWDVEDFDGIGRYVESDVTIERELFYRTMDVFGG